MLKRHWAVLSLGAAIVVATLLLLHLGRHQTLVVDQWGFLWSSRGWGPKTLLYPHNGHLSLLPLVVYKTMFAVFGIGSHLPYQLITLALSATIATLLFVLVRDGVGDLLALAAAVLVLFYGAGADAILPTSQLGNLVALATGLGMLGLLRREDLPGDLGACLLLGMSLASFTVGVAFAVGGAAMLALRPDRRGLSRAWVVLLPVAAFGAWVLWARQFGEETVYVHNLKTLGSAVLDQLGASLAGLTGLFTTPNGPPPSIDLAPIRTDWGPALVVGLVAIAIVRLRRPPRPGARAIAAAAVLVSYFVLVAIALNIFRNTNDSRLVYIGSVLTLFALAELCAPYRPTRAALAAIGALFLISICANVAELGDSAKLLRAESASDRAKLTALEIAGPSVPAAFQIEEPGSDMAFELGIWRELKDEFGSPAYSPAELREAPAGARAAADEELVRALAIQPRPARPFAPLAAPPARWIRVLAVAKGVARQRRACVRLEPLPDARMEALLRLPAGGFRYVSPERVGVTLGRYGDTTTVALPGRGGAVSVAIPADASRLPWSASLQATAPALVCPLGSPT